MALTAENLAEQYKLTRKDCDEYALQSQKRWKHANANGHFKDEITPVKIKGKKGDEFFQIDEHARGDATIEELGKLAPVFKKNGTVTAGNASGVCDGAASVIIADEESVKKYNLKPLARFAGYQASGCDPKIMGIYFRALNNVCINKNVFHFRYRSSSSNSKSIKKIKTNIGSYRFSGRQ
jgi:acetyl-CoA acyltransferase 2